MKTLQKLMIASFCMTLMAVKCKPDPPTVPPPTQACAKLGEDFYNCEDGNPGVLVFDGKGTLKLSVTGDNPIQFSQKVVYRPNTFFSPAVTLQNGTTYNPSAHSIVAATPSSDLRFEVPFNDSYTIKAYYIEYGFPYPDPASTGNAATCFNPQPNSCYRWYKMASVASGTYPSCLNNYTIVINQQDPDGFIGGCQ